MKQNEILLNYIWLLQTIIESEGITFKEINERWIADKMNEGDHLSRSTFHRYRHEVEEAFGLIINCDEKYRYHIQNPSALRNNTVANWLFTRVSDGITLMNCGRISDRIITESAPSAKFFLLDIVDSMKNNFIIIVDYQKYQKDHLETYRLQPYYIKLYHQKWYMVAKKEDGELHLFCLDRVKSVTKTEEHFTMDEDDTVEKYFRYSYGVVVDERVPVCKVVLRAYSTEPFYLRDLPLHHSQRELGSGDGYTDFEYELRPSLEFMGKILERGDRIEVISPEHFRQQIKGKLSSIVKLYQ